jgi:2-polyprenyl-3-methyl-5-hydroxy-6-metoxy-1,4-benzoquinol methylase
MSTESLTKLYDILVKKNDPDILPYLEAFRKIINKSDFQILKDLLRSNKWPKAVDSNLICDLGSDEDKFNRAEGILELVVEKPLRDKRFLDFGCGEGHIAAKALEQNPAVSVGYDIVETENWKTFEKKDNFALTTDLEEMRKHAPYDVILIYDVLDHMENGQVASLKDLKGVLSDDGLMYIRFHPFCSRHATHQYQDLNKAFVHLVFTEQELETLGVETPKVSHIMHPIAEYGEWMKKAGLKTVNYNILREKVEGFFTKNNAIKERVRQHYAHTEDKRIRKGAFPTFQLEQQFLDYVVKK